LDFDEDEALLAIVTVCAFAIVLTDQIAERVAFQQAQSAASAALIPVAPSSTPLLQRTADLIAQFTAQFQAAHAGSDIASPTERVIIEIKRIRKTSPKMEEQAILQVATYMKASGITQAIIFLLSSPNTGKVARRTATLPEINGEIIVILSE
jgi:hypothetical protein